MFHSGGPPHMRRNIGAEFRSPRTPQNGINSLSLDIPFLKAQLRQLSVDGKIKSRNASVIPASTHASQIGRPMSTPFTDLFRMCEKKPTANLSISDLGFLQQRPVETDTKKFDKTTSAELNEFLTVDWPNYTERNGIGHLIHLFTRKSQKYWLIVIGKTLAEVEKLPSMDFYQLLFDTIPGLQTIDNTSSLLGKLKMPAGQPFSEVALATFVTDFNDLLATNPKILKSRDTPKLVSSFINLIEPTDLRESLRDENPASLDHCYEYLYRTTRDGGVGLVHTFITMAQRNKNDLKYRSRHSAPSVLDNNDAADTALAHKSRWAKRVNRNEGLRAAAATTTEKLPREVFIPGACFGCQGVGPLSRCAVCRASPGCLACGPSVGHHKCWQVGCEAQQNWYRLKAAADAAAANAPPPAIRKNVKNTVAAATVEFDYKAGFLAQKEQITQLMAAVSSLIKVRQHRLMLQTNSNDIPPFSLMPQLMKKFHANALSNTLLDINPPDLFIASDVMPSHVLKNMPPLLFANRSVESNPVTVDTGASSIFSPIVSNLDSPLLSPVIGNAHVQCAGGQFNAIDGKGKFLDCDAYVVNSFDNMLLGVSEFCKPQTNTPAKIVIFSPDSAVGILVTPKINSILNNLLALAQSDNLVKLEATQKNGIYITDVESLKSLHINTKVQSLKHLFAGASTYLTTEFKTIAEKVLFFHHAFGHANKESMCFIVKNQLISNLPSDLTVKTINKWFPICSSCSKGNMAAAPLHSNPIDRDIKKGEEIEIDIKVWQHNIKKDKPHSIGRRRDKPVASFSGATKTLTAIDKKTKYLFGFSLHATDKLLKYIIQIRNRILQKGRVLETIRIDNQFVTQEIRDYCNKPEINITIKACIPYEHLETVNIERRHRTIQDGVVKDLDKDHLDDRYCAMAYNNQLDVLNMMPDPDNPSTSAEIEWEGKALDLLDTPILPFGTIVQAHIPLVLQTPLSGRSFEAIAVGMAKNHRHGIQLFNPKTKRIIIRRTIKVMGIFNRVVSPVYRVPIEFETEIDEVDVTDDPRNYGGNTDLPPILNPTIPTPTAISPAPTALPPVLTPVDVDGQFAPSDEEVEVEAILSHTGNPRKPSSMKFLLKWKDRPDDTKSWRPYSEVKDLALLDPYIVLHPKLSILPDSIPDFTPLVPDVVVPSFIPRRSGLRSSTRSYPLVANTSFGPIPKSKVPTKSQRPKDGWTKSDCRTHRPHGRGGRFNRGGGHSSCGFTTRMISKQPSRRELLRHAAYCAEVKVLRLQLDSLLVASSARAYLASLESSSVVDVAHSKPYHIQSVQGSPFNLVACAAYRPIPLLATNHVQSWPTEVLIPTLPYSAKDIFIPKSVQQAKSSIQFAEWHSSTQDELKSMKTMGVWRTPSIPISAIPKNLIVPSKLVYDVKTTSDGNFDKFKVRLCARGDRWEDVFGVETYAGTVKSESVRFLLGIAAELDYEIECVDVKTAFLHSSLTPGEVVYLRRPVGLSDEDMPEIVELIKCIYGLPQASARFREHSDATLKNIGFTPLISDPCVYVMRTPAGETVFAAVHVDDIGLMGSSKAILASVKKDLSRTYTLTEQLDMSSYLGMHIIRDRAAKSVTLLQDGYVETLLSRFAADINCTSFPTTPMLATGSSSASSPPIFLNSAGIADYQGMIGSLLYLANQTRPDILFAVCAMARKSKSPTDQDRQAVVRILQYIAGTKTLGLRLHSGEGIVLYATVDASYACHPDLKSHTGCTLHIGRHSGSVNSLSKKQTITADSSTVAELIGAHLAAHEIMWARNFLSELGFPQTSPTVLFEDNLSTISLIVNKGNGERTKHIQLRHNFVREQVVNDIIKMTHLSGVDMISDILTKPLGPTAFLHLRPRLLGMNDVEIASLYSACSALVCL